LVTNALSTIFTAYCLVLPPLVVLLPLLSVRRVHATTFAKAPSPNARPNSTSAVLILRTLIPAAASSAASLEPDEGVVGCAGSCSGLPLPAAAGEGCTAPEGVLAAKLTA
jgi:hypothetical protein